MGVRMSAYGREMDKSEKGVSLQEQHKKAVQAAKTRTGKKAESNEGMLKKTKRRLKELFYGERTYTSGHKKPKKPSKKIKTKRTEQVESGLKKAGLSESDLAKFRKK